MQVINQKQVLKDPLHFYVSRFGAPAFISFPHFYLADPSYREPIEGMHPNRSEHEFLISLEPHTGIPLQVRAQMQINILIEAIPGIEYVFNL